MNSRAVPAVVRIFADLYAARFPIRQMTPVDTYGGSDDASAAHDNTSGFNCRLAVSIGPPSWSRHAYGEAVDINPVENPYLEGGRVIPPAGGTYINRRSRYPGMLEPGSAALTVFRDHGWFWGGTWGSPDYQHISDDGR